MLNEKVFQKKRVIEIISNIINFPHTTLISIFVLLGNVLASEVEEARMLVDTAERAKKNADGEVS